MVTRRRFLKQASALAVGAAVFPGHALSGLSVPDKEGPMQHVETVLGPVAPDDLGVTLIHEHIMVDFIGAQKTGPHRWQVDEVVEVMLPYLRALREAGGQTLVECTPKYLGRDVRVLKRLAQASGLHIITNTGLYKEPYLPPYVVEGTAESLAEEWTREAREGVAGSGVRPGFIKIAVNEGPLNQVQEKIVRAAGLTHRCTGLTIASHTTEGKTALQELDVLAQEGVAASAFIWVHSDGEPDAGLRREAGARGAWIELDGIDPASPRRHIAMIEELFDAGLRDQVLISQDRGWYGVGEPRGGTPRPYEKLLTDFIPSLEKAKVAHATIKRLLIDNPRRALTPRIRQG